MKWHRIAVLAFLSLALATGGGQLTAKEEKKKASEQGHDRLEALASKLGLSAQQKEAIHKVHADFDKQANHLEEQLWALHHEEHQAMGKVLTDEQRGKLPGILREEMDKELNKVAAHLGLNDEQKQKLQKIRTKYEKRFHDFAGQKSESGRKQMHELRAEALAEVRRELNAEQRAKLPGIMREEFHQWHDPAAQHDHLKSIGDKLGLSADQKKQVQKIHAEYHQKIEKPANQLKQLHQDEHAAVEKVLTDEQRSKLHEMLKARGRSE